MSNKQIACVVLAMILGLMGYGTLAMKKKLAAASEARDEASTKAIAAENARKKAQLDLNKMDRETQGLRDYLDEWQPYLMQTKTESEAERMFNTKLKQGSLVIWRQSFEPVKLTDESTIPNALRARITFEDDYYKMLNWVGSLESSLPTCRVSTCRITKGAKGNDIKMDLDVEVPLASTE